MHLLRRAAPPGTTTAPLERSSLKTAAQGQFCKPRVEKNSPFSDARSRRRAGQGGMIFDLSKPMATLTTPELCVNRQFCPSRSEARIYELHEGVSQACGWRNSRIWRVGHRRSRQPNAAGDRAWPCCPPRRALDFWLFPLGEPMPADGEQWPVQTARGGHQVTLPGGAIAWRPGCPFWRDGGARGG